MLQEVPSMSLRPIREIVNTRELRPVGKGSVVRDRRISSRFTCRLPAVLIAKEREFPVECQEISATGARVSSQRPLPVAVGEHVVVRIRVGSQNFEDRFTVVRTSRGRTGPISVHLGLQTHESGGACVPADGADHLQSAKS